METIVEIGVQNALMATLLACVVAAVCRVVRRPAVRHCLWLLVLLKLLTPPFWDWPIEWAPVQVQAQDLAVVSPIRESESPHSPDEPLSAPTPSTNDLSALEAIASGPRESESSAEARSVTAESVAPTPDYSATLREIDWSRVAVGIWLAGSLLFLAVAACRVWRFRRLLRRAQEADDEVRRRMVQVAALIGVRRLPTVFMTPWAVAPVLCAIGRKTSLLLPEPLWRRLTEEQGDTLLAHELAHLRRKDHWVRWLELVAFVLYFWHPVVWWARRQLRDAEEECCDAWVIATRPAARDAYADALVETVSFLSERRAGLPLLASSAAHVRFLQRRLTMIMKGTPRARLSWLGIAALLLLGPVLPLRPTFAQQATLTPAQQSPADPFAANKLAPTGSSIYYRAAQNAAATESSPDLGDEIELLRVQLTAKQAETQEAKALLEQARRTAERLGRARANGAVPEDEVDQAKTELLVREARLQVKEAQAKEAALRLSQAERRQGSSKQRGGALFETKPAANVPLGPSSQPPASSAAQGKYPASAEPAKTPVYGPATSRSAPAQGHEDRLAALEKKIDALTKELAGLRQQLGQRPYPDVKK